MTGAPANAQGVPPPLRHTGRLHPGAVSRAPRCKAIGNSMAVPCGLARTTPATGLAITGARKKPIVGRRHEPALPFCHHLLLTPVSTMPAATVPGCDVEVPRRPIQSASHRFTRTCATPSADALHSRAIPRFFIRRMALPRSELPSCRLTRIQTTTPMAHRLLEAPMALCSKSRLFEFGGHGCVISNEVIFHPRLNTGTESRRTTARGRAAEPDR